MSDMDPIIVLRAIIALPIIFFIPGYVTFNAYRLNKIEDSKLSFFETLFLQVLISIVFTGWIAFILAMSGYFSLMNLLGFLLVYIFVIAVKFKVNFNLSSFPKPTLDKQSLFLISLVILAVSLFFQPAETFGGFGDSYMYYNQAGVIVNHGSFSYNDPLISSLPESLSKTLIAPLITSATNYKTGEIQFRVFQLYPTWIAIFYSIFGLMGSMYTSAFFGLFGILSFYLIIKHYFNWRISFISTVLLSLNYIQIWAVRLHQSEIFFQFLIFSTFVIFIAFERSRKTAFGALLIASFGSLFITRIESILIMIPLIIFTLFCNLGIQHKNDNKSHSSLFRSDIKKLKPIYIILFVLILSIIIYYYNTTIAVYIRIYDELISPIFYMLISLFLFSYLINFKHLLSINKLTKKILQIKKNHIQHILAISVFLFILFIYLATNPDTPISKGWHNIELLSLYLSSPVLYIGIIGLVAIIYSKKRFDSMWLFWGIGILYLVYFVSDVRHQQCQPWMMRRFISIIIPVLYLGVAVLIFELGKITSINYKKYSMTLLCLYLIIIATVSISSGIIGYAELKGTIYQINDLFNSFDDNSILIFVDNSYPQFAYPLRYISNKNSFMLPSDTRMGSTFPKKSSDIDAFVDAYEIWHSTGKTVYIVNPSNDFIRAFEDKFQFTLYNERTINSNLMGYESRKFPTKYGNFEKNIKIYEISPK